MSKRELNFDKHNIVLAMSEVKDMFRMHFDRGCRYVAKRVYEKVLAVDFNYHINAGRYQRTSLRRSQRNGYRQRSLLTSVGALDLQVPRDRSGQFQPTLFKRYKRVDSLVDQTIRSMFLLGVSTRKVGDILDVLCGERLSASYVSTVTAELDGAVRDFANARIEDDFVMLILDALSVRVRLGLKAKRIMVLVAYGIRADGSRRLISFQRAKSESAACWKAFLENLHVRGLRGKQLKLIVLDGAKGLWSAVEQVYPLVAHQLCWVHRLRNVVPQGMRRPGHGDHECPVAGPPRRSGRGVAEKRFRTWKRKWQNRIPRAVKCLESDFDRLIPVFEFPQEIPSPGGDGTTNVIERCFREVRRRLKVMGYFQNGKSCDRIVFAIFSYFNRKWERNSEKIKSIKMLYEKAA